MLWLPILFLTLAGTVTHAQTQAQIQACANTIELISYEADPTWSTTDTTHYFNATYTFNATTCMSPAMIPINRLYLADLDGGFTYNCPKPSAFTSSGMIYTQCSQTLGFIATQSEQGDVNWGIIIALGVRPTLYTIENDFVVNNYTPPQPSGLSRRTFKRKGFGCLPGYSYCAVGSNSSECINTDSDLSSCGGCPSDPSFQDCAAIAGADHVECRASKCIVNSCVRGYQVSVDRRSCVKRLG